MKHDQSDTSVLDILASVQSIAVIGFSDDPERESNSVARFLKTRGYRVFGVNPKLAGRVVDGISVYARVGDIPGSVDMVDIFRREDFLEEEIHQAVEQRSEKGIRVIWLQLGLTHPVAEAFARAQGLDVVSNRCPRIELGKVQSLS